MNALQFQECIRHINCMSFTDFLKCFKEDGQYLFNKFNIEFNKDIGKFICYLDSSNLNTLFRYLEIYLVDNNIGE